VLNLLDHRERQAKVGKAGADYVKEHRSWTAITKELVGHYSDAIKGVLAHGLPV
jgi:hypothetical protein